MYNTNIYTYISLNTGRSRHLTLFLSKNQNLAWLPLFAAPTQAEKQKREGDTTAVAVLKR